MFLLGILSVQAYNRLYQERLDEYRQVMIPQRAGLSQIIATVHGHVDVMHRMAVGNLSGANGDLAPSSALGGLDPAKPSREMTGLVLAPPGRLDAAPETRRELAAAEALFPFLSAAHDTHAYLRWSYLFAASRNFVIIFPWAPGPEMLRGKESLGAAFDAYFTYDVFLDGTPDRNPQRQVYWTPVYFDAGGSGLMVSHAAPLWVGESFRGIVGTDVLLAFLSDFLKRFSPLPGRIGVVDQKDQAVADPAGTAAQGQNVIPARAIVGDVLTDVTKGSYVRQGDDYVLVLAIDGTPWKLVHVVPAATVQATALAGVRPFALIVAGILLSLVVLYLALRGQFVGPASRLASFVGQAADGAAIALPPVPTPWRPLVVRVGEAFAAQRSLIEQLRAAEGLKAAVIEAAIDAVVIADEEGRITSLNASAERIFGQRAGEAKGRLISEFIVTLAGQANHAEGVQRDWVTNEVYLLGRRVELEARRADGSRFPAEVSVQRVIVEGRELSTLFVRDLTAAKAAQAEIEHQRERLHQIEKLSAMGSLLAGVAHELNNPLAILLAQATLLRDKANTEDLKRRAERIHAAAERSSRIVKSFLAMARQKPPQREPTSLNEVVRAALDMTAYGTRSAGIEIEVDLDPALPLIEADRDLMGQVATNLLLNAQQVLVDRSGPRRIWIATERARDSVALTVADNGPGVAPEIATKIFEPYFTTKPVGAGTGIGLSVCHNVVQAHGGRIELAEREGGGAVFRVTLPLTDAGAGAGVEDSAEGAGTFSTLVVDDEVDVAHSLAEILETLGHQATVVEAPGEALQRIRSERFDFVFADLRMPGMGGVELRRRIRELDTALAARTILMTGDTVVGPTALIRRPDDPIILLEKPFSVSDVSSALKRAAQEAV